MTVACNARATLSASRLQAIVLTATLTVCSAGIGLAQAQDTLTISEDVCHSGLLHRCLDDADNPYRDQYGDRWGDADRHDDFDRQARVEREQLLDLREERREEQGIAREEERERAAEEARRRAEAEAAARPAPGELQVEELRAALAAVGLETATVDGDARQDDVMLVIPGANAGPQAGAGTGARPVPEAQADAEGG